MKRKPSIGRISKDYLKQIIPLLVFDLLLLLFLKYKFNHLSVRDFSISAFGNILNISLTLINIAGIIAAGKMKKTSSSFNRLPILVLICISCFIHLFILFHEYFHINVPAFLSGVASTNRVYYMYLFILSQLIQFYVLALIISALLAETKFIYLKALFKMIFISVVFVLFSFFYSVLKKHGEDTLKKGEYDTGVVLGAAVWQGNKPSPIFEGRIDKAYELYTQKIISKIQLTGSNAPGEKSEAKTASDYLKKKGMDAKDLLIEEKSSNTVEQIAFLKLKNTGTANLGRIVIISDEFHLVRALEICSFFEISAKSSASEHNITSEKLLYYRLRESAALLLFWFFAV